MLEYNVLEIACQNVDLQGQLVQKKLCSGDINVCGFWNMDVIESNLQFMLCWQMSLEDKMIFDGVKISLNKGEDINACVKTF